MPRSYGISRGRYPDSVLIFHLNFACLFSFVVSLLFLSDSNCLAFEMPSQGIVAHRGASVFHPENTWSAFQEAIDLGAQQIEFDVRWSSDKKLVLMHDSTLARTTDVATIFPGRENDHVNTFSLAELKQLDAGSWKGAQFAGESIPTLAEALLMMPMSIWLNLDMKVHQSEFGEDIAKAVLALGREHQSILSATFQPVIGTHLVEQLSGRNLLINNMQNQGTGTSYVDATINGGYDFIQFLGGPFPSEADIQRLEDEQIRMNYCCSSGAGATTLTSWYNKGIDFPLVDNVSGGLVIAEGLGIPRLVPIAPGDFDEDIDVDGADFLSWQRGLGTDYTSAYLPQWLDNFREVVATASPISVPEPCSGSILILALWALAMRRSQNHS